jgi:hypothetical protein
MGNVAAVTNAVQLDSTGTHQVHYLRTMGPFGPESLAALPRRSVSNRNNAYNQPLAYQSLAQGLLNFDTRQCGAGVVATLNPNTPNEASFNARTGGDVKKATDLFERLKHFALGDQESTASTPAPSCGQQAPFQPIYGNGAATQYQHTFEQGE